MGQKIREEELTRELQKELVKKKKLGILPKIFLILLLIPLLCALGCYAYGVYYFSGHYFYGTVIDQTDASFLTREEEQRQILKKYQVYALRITGREGLFDEIRSEDMDFSLSPETALCKIMNEQEAFLWPEMFFGENVHVLEDCASFNPQKAEKKLRETVFFETVNISMPKGARLSDFNEKTGRYEVLPKEEGTLLLWEKTRSVVQKALENAWTEVNLDEQGCYEAPDTSVDDARLQRVADSYNSYLQLLITYAMHGEQVTLSPAQLHSCLAFTGEESGETSVSVSEEQTKALVEELAGEYDTYGKERTFRTTAGQTVTLKSGSYGWKLDQEAETKWLFEQLTAKRNGSRTPEYTSEGYYLDGMDDIGKDYVEINLSAQHLYVYREGSIVLESDFVSGNLARGHGTPAGVFGITYKTRNAVLRGEDYESPVSYWMPFNRGIGMHDATWRGKFGGTIYKTAGSHGCINLPLARAKEIYGLVEKNMPVICYY